MQKASHRPQLPRIVSTRRRNATGTPLALVDVLAADILSEPQLAVLSATHFADTEPRRRLAEAQRGGGGLPASLKKAYVHVLRGRYSEVAPAALLDTLTLLHEKGRTGPGSRVLFLGALRHLVEMLFEPDLAPPTLHRDRSMVRWALLQKVSVGQLVAMQATLLDGRRHGRGDPPGAWFDSILPPVADPLLESIFERGLVEPHRHLNLSLLPELTWAGLVKKAMSIARRPDAASRELRCGWTLEMAARHLICAGQARCMLGRWLDQIPDRGDEAEQWRELVARPTESLLRHPPPPVSAWQRPGPPGRLLAPEQIMRVERRWLFRLMYALSRGASGWHIAIAHYYLLVQNVFVSEMVQPQWGENSLERFVQDFVRSPLREDVEGSQSDAIAQAAAFRVRHLEARKSTIGSVEQKCRAFLAAASRLYNGGVARPVANISERLVRPAGEGDRRGDATLTLHFLRAPDTSDPDQFKRLGAPVDVRHGPLRRDLWLQAREVARVRSQRDLASHVTAVDVANLETDTPIEVFAPMIRWLRGPAELARAPIGLASPARSDLRVTIHAGEHFHHLIGGIRAIDEAIHFCDLRPGDRIGHGLALGVSSDEWFATVGTSITMRRGEWLDDLIWLCMRLRAYDHALHAGVLSETRRLAAEVYGVTDLDTLIDAWSLRRHPALSLKVGPSPPHPNIPTWQAIRDRTGCSEDAIACWRAYHCDRKVRAKWNELIAVEPLACRDTDPSSARDGLSRAIQVVQGIVEATVRQRQLAIEVCPSSNVIVGSFATLEEHPIFRWHPPGEAPNVTVVIGSDDPAIFVTELQYEYARLAAAARRRGVAPHVVHRWLADLAATTEAYRFRPHATP